MRRICAVVILAVLAFVGANAQIFCWNLENYFDTYNDPVTADDPFTPGGEYRWTRRKETTKRNLIARTIIASAECFGGELPALVGLCEVENALVLKRLVEDTPLAKVRYRYIHRDSPDPRGIDVALLYDPARVRVLDYGFITVRGFATREILYARVVFGGGAAGPEGGGSNASATDSSAWQNAAQTAAPPGGSRPSDTLHLYVNHWPSKYSGAKASEAKRRAVCDALEHNLDSLLAAEPAAKIILMGDFNDTPSAPTITALTQRQNLINLTENLPGGTIRFKGKWEMIDQLLASPAAAARIESVDIYKPAFLLEEDREFMGFKPRRTNVGPRYNGGASDHLPVVACLKETF